MIHLTDSDVKLLDELLRFTHNRLFLSKSLESAYTKQLSYISEDNIDCCLKCIETTDDIFSKFNDVNNNINVIIEKLSIDKTTIHNALFFDSEIQSCPECLNGIIEIFKASNKVLKNCNTLNERVTFQLSIQANNIQTKLSDIKNRKLIEQSYGRINESKTSNVIGYSNI